MHLLHDLTSPRWTEVGGAEVLSLDEEGHVDADIIFGAPPRQKVFFCGQLVTFSQKHVIINNLYFCHL